MPKKITLFDQKQSLFKHTRFEDAIAEAVSEYKDLLILFTTPSCLFCDTFKSDLDSDPEIKNLLSRLATLELDMEVNYLVTRRYNITSAPTVLILSADGYEKGRINSLGMNHLFKDKLIGILAVKSGPIDFRLLKSLMDRASQGALTDVEWASLMRALGNEEARKIIHDSLMRLSPFPAKPLVAQLRDAQLIVRLGALELLEEAAGETFDFDPWEPVDGSEMNGKAWEKWDAWAYGYKKEAPENLYIALTHQQIMRYLHDLISNNRNSYMRAKEKLEQAGMPILPKIDDFLNRNQKLAVGLSKRIREVKYAILLAAQEVPFHGDLAHRLVFGNLDLRLQAIRELEQLGLEAVPMLKDYLEDSETMVRETAIDTLIKAGGREVIPVIEKHAVRENDDDVKIIIIKGLGHLRSKRSLQMLVGYLDSANEDLVIAALQSIGALKTQMAEKEIRKSLGDQRWRVRIAALHTVAELKMVGLAGHVEKRLEDQEPFVRYNAVKALTALNLKAAVPKLEKIYHRDDQLKGPIINAFCRFEMPLPDSLAVDLETLPSDVLFSVLDSLRSCGRSGLSMAAELSGHPNRDIACSALRILGAKGIETAEYRQLLIDRLNAGAKPDVLAVLQSALLSDRQKKSMGLNVLKSGRSEGPVSTSSAGRDENERFLNDLYDLFLEDASPGAGSAGNREAEKVTLDDLAAAFGLQVEEAASTAKSGADARGHGSVQDLMSAVKPLLQHEDALIRQAAALFLVNYGDLDQVGLLIETLGNLAINKRLGIIEQIEGIADMRLLGLARMLLNDSAEQVRRSASKMVIKNAAYKKWLDLLFDTLEKKNTPLSISDVEWSYFDSLMSEADCRENLHGRVKRYLKSSKSDKFKNLSMLLAAKCFRRSDTKYIQANITSDNPWVRRAAFYTLGRMQRQIFIDEIDKCANDPSDYVRQVIPAIFQKESNEWRHYFDEGHFIEEYIYNQSEIISLPDRIKSVLNRLVQDKSAIVRFESMMTLLDYFEKVDLAHLKNTARILGDTARARVRVGRFIERHYATLGIEYNILLPFLKYINLEDAKRVDIINHFKRYYQKGKPPSYIAKSSSTMASATAPEPEKRPVQAQRALTELPVIFFSDPACDSCREVQDFLDDLKKEHPRLCVEKHNINKYAAEALNEQLCRQFNVPDADWRIAPSVFAGGGYLIGDALTYNRLDELIHLSKKVPRADWYPPAAAPNPQPAIRPVQKMPAPKGSSPIWIFASGILISIALLFFILRKKP